MRDWWAVKLLSGAVKLGKYSPVEKLLNVIKPPKILLHCEWQLDAIHRSDFITFPFVKVFKIIHYSVRQQGPLNFVHF